ncbi:type II toxin-antitoxin system HicB family antitoxin [Chloroflexales bacterium ZM16-3]|nr:type II toxin-antitoxin system HicB family antitoxin [Chloroflexales bacterium ZM16-3]
MMMHVLIEQKPEGKVTASLLGWPDITAEGTTEDEAVHALRHALAAHLQDAKIVPLEVSGEQPWLQTAGMFRDDRFADELDTLIAEHRRERDAEAISSAE